MVTVRAGGGALRTGVPAAAEVPQAPAAADAAARRPGFGLTEVVVALVVFAVGALGAAALTAHAARITARAARYETVLWRTVTLLDSLAAAAGATAGAAAGGSDADADATYQWSVDGDSATRAIHVTAIVRASADTIRLTARRPVPPPRLTGVQR